MGKDKNRVGINGTDAETGRVRGEGDGTLTPGKKPPKECPISRETFVEKAPASLLMKVGEQLFGLPRKEKFSTGSFGYHLNQQITLEIDGKAVAFQLNCGLTAVGSKNNKEEAAV